MRVAVLSGKGGTGKTFVAVNLAAVAGTARYVDCDVEEPNGHIFFRPEGCRDEPVQVTVPVIDHETCDGCRQCVDFCRFNALAVIGGRMRVFERLCHSCGACQVVCPLGAISETHRVIGRQRSGRAGKIAFHDGVLAPGEESGVPIIHRLLEEANGAGELTVLDCPPGAACPVMEPVRAADYCVVVAEPTLFGLHNLRMVLELVHLFGKPCGVVVNKATTDDSRIEDFCRAEQIPVLGRIPYDPHLAVLNSDGRIVADHCPTCAETFRALLSRIIREARA